MDALSDDVEALAADVAVQGMLGTACCCYRKKTSFCLLSEPLKMADKKPK
jgi:hypothetical protein